MGESSQLDHSPKKTGGLFLKEVYFASKPLNPNDKGTKTQREIEIWIDAAAARKDGLKFYKVPENDYIATEGLGSGLPLKYFIKAVDLESGEIIKVFN